VHSSRAVIDLILVRQSNLSPLKEAETGPVPTGTPRWASSIVPFFRQKPVSNDLPLEDSGYSKLLISWASKERGWVPCG
jgi:hypothetical protein